MCIRARVCVGGYGRTHSFLCFFSLSLSHFPPHSDNNISLSFSIAGGIREFPPHSDNIVSVSHLVLQEG